MADDRLDELVELIRPLGRVLVAFSGGADSALVAWAARRALGDGAFAVTARSESLAPAEADQARALAARIGIAHEEVDYSELAIPGYAENRADRCYLCKGELFSRLAALAAERGGAAILDGSNADDLSDFRPGRRAAGEQGVRAPLAELGWGKAEIRDALRSLELPVWDKPSSPCLSSRVPYGEAITREKLEQIGRAEAALRELGFRDLRVRHHGPVARVELRPEDLERAVEPEMAGEIVDRVRAAGF
ncbi:MAG: ATP-dependent sacrificial sulfur transferase LarE, partial [Acidobacteriota bacterium]